VPVGDNRFALGVVARVGKRGRIVSGYFFGPLFEDAPTAAELAVLKPQGATLVVRFGDLHPMSDKWPILSRIGSWDRPDWPMPEFVRIEPISGRVFLVSFSDIDPGERLSQDRIAVNSSNLEIDSLWGAGAVEAFLATRLTIA
jgi:hypothetical protein